MLIGLVTRASRGHSGHELWADNTTWRLHWAIQAVALLRMLPDLSVDPWFWHWISMTGLLWLIPFAGWSWKYAPMTWRRRFDGKAG